MGHKVYNLSGDNLTVVNAVVTLAFINPPATGPDIKIVRTAISQAGTIVLRQRVQIVTQPTSFPTLVSATPRPGAFADIASVITGNTTGAAGTCGVNASAEGAGAKVVYWPDAFDAMAGFLRVLTPEERHEMNGGVSSGIGVYFPVATGASPATLGWIVNVTYQED